MSTLHVPSGAVALLDLDNILPERVEALTATGALAVVFQNPTAYRIRETRDGVVLRTLSRRARTVRNARRVALLAAACLSLAYVHREAEVATADPTVYTTTTGETLTVREGRVTEVRRGSNIAKPKPTVVVVFRPTTAKPAHPSRSGVRVSPALRATERRTVPVLPPQAAERAREVVGKHRL